VFHDPFCSLDDRDLVFACLWRQIAEGDPPSLVPGEPAHADDLAIDFTHIGADGRLVGKVGEGFDICSSGGADDDLGHQTRSFVCTVGTSAIMVAGRGALALMMIRVSGSQPLGKLIATSS